MNRIHLLWNTEISAWLVLLDLSASAFIILGSAHILRLLAKFLHSQELCLEGGVWHEAGFQPLGEKSYGEGEQEDQGKGSEGAQRARATARRFRPQTWPTSAGSQEAGGGAERGEGQEGGGAEAEAEAQPG